MQHFRRLAATVVVSGLLGLGVGQAFAQALPPATEAGTSESAANPYVQRGVPAEATAENAVIARTKAIASAQRLAYQRMASDLGLPTGVSDSQIDQMVSSIIVEEERTSRTAYSGRLTVNFNPNRVPGAAGRSVAGGSAPATGSSDVAPPVMPSAAPAGHIEAEARFGGMREWLEIRRRLYSNPEIASVDIRAIAVDGARLRLGLRHGPEVAAQVLPTSGLSVIVPTRAPAAAQGRLAPPVPFGASPPAAPPGGEAGGPWQIGLASRF